MDGSDAYILKKAKGPFNLGDLFDTSKDESDIEKALSCP